MKHPNWSIRSHRVYVVDADGRSGCESIQLSMADPIHLDYLFVYDVDSCYGRNNGRIEITASIFNGSPVEYSIDNGQTFDSIGYFNFLSAGMYQVLIRDTYECILKIDSINISQPDKIHTGFILGNNNVTEWDITFYSVTNKTGSVYTWMLEGGNIISGQGSNFISVQWGSGLTGSVSVVETDAIGCTGDTVCLEVSIKGLGIKDEENKYGQIIVYPNPFNESTTIIFNNPERYFYTFSIMDLTGKIVKTTDNITDEKIELSKGILPAGLYLIELRGPNIYRGKLLIE